MKIGDKIISTLDGLEYTIIEIGPRDKLEPLPGVRLIGDAIIVEDSIGKKQLLYEWEVEQIAGSDE